MKEAVITVEDIKKHYRIFDTHGKKLLHTIFPSYKKNMQEVCALKGASFTIYKGESVGVIGRNGGGKSTLLQILSGTLQATTGTIRRNGRISALLELGSGFHPAYSGRDNVILNGLLLGLSKKEILARFHEIEEFAEIGSAIDRPVHTYSSGMAMRLAFSVQVLCRPEILIIDEALSVGDFFFQQKCLSYIRKLCAEGVTLLFVSHDMSVIRDLCTRAIYLKNGEVVFDGDSKQAVSLFFNEKNNTTHAETSERSSCKVPDSTEDLDHFKRQAIWSNPDGEKCGSLIAIAFFNDKGEPTTFFRMGETMQISVAYRPHPDYKNEIIVGLTNKYAQLTTAVGSYQLGIQPAEDAKNKVLYFDLWLALSLESGNYGITVTLNYSTDKNAGERLDQSPMLGPIQILWDYTKEVAPFIGMCGLPARAKFREYLE